MRRMRSFISEEHPRLVREAERDLIEFWVLHVLYSELRGQGWSQALFRLSEPRPFVSQGPL